MTCQLDTVIKLHRTSYCQQGDVAPKNAESMAVVCFVVVGSTNLRICENGSQWFMRPATPMLRYIIISDTEVSTVVETQARDCDHQDGKHLPQIDLKFLSGSIVMSFIVVRLSSDP